MPRASPEAMTKPASPRSRARVPREFQPGAGGVARADDRDHRPHQHILRAAHAEQRRRIVKRGQPRRIAGFVRREQADAELLAGGELSARIVLAADPARTRRAAAPRQIRQPLQRGARAAEMIDAANGRCAARHCRSGSAAASRSARASVRCVVLEVLMSTLSPAAAWINRRAWATGICHVIPGALLRVAPE